MGYITVFGGTFNPPHIGHLEIVSALSKHDLVEKVLLIPTKVPPHKETDFLASEEDRIAMLELIAADFDNVTVSDIEFKRAGKSFTVDTLREIKEIFPDKEIALTVGADMLISLPTWKEYDNILKLCKIFTFFREGADIEQYTSAILELKSNGAEIYVLEDEIQGVSSTMVREKLCSGEDVSSLLPAEVFDFIKSRGVYRG